MKCPYCDYSSGWDGETMTDIDGEHGNFYQLSNSVQMVRDEHIYSSVFDKKTVCGCPKCGKIFMNL